MIVPSDRLGKYLTDRGPRFSEATRAVERARAGDLPLVVLALEHDGPGPALAKRRTRQGGLGKASEHPFLYLDCIEEFAVTILRSVVY